MWCGSIVNWSIFLKSVFRRNSFRKLLKVIVKNKNRSNWKQRPQDIVRVDNKDTTMRTLFSCLSGVSSIILNFVVDLELLATISMFKVDCKIVQNNLSVGRFKRSKKDLINPFLANVSVLYPLKTPESLTFFDVLRG